MSVAGEAQRVRRAVMEQEERTPQWKHCGMGRGTKRGPEKGRESCLSAREEGVSKR